MIRIGVKCDSPPFGSSGPDGKPVGIEVEMAKQIGAYAFGSPDKAELSCVATDARIPSLTGRKIDLILATLGKTPPREQVIDYSDIYYWGSSNVAVPKDSPVQSLADLKGKSILIVKGGNQIKWLRDRFPASSSFSSTRRPTTFRPCSRVGPTAMLPMRITMATAEQQLPESAHPQGRGRSRHQRGRHPQERARAQGLRERGAEEDEGREVLHRRW